MIIYFDTETTGFMPGRIVQLSYIMHTASEVKAKNFFFAVSYVEPSAAAVTGLTPEKLYVLSGGRTFFDHADEIYDDFAAADLTVSHNLDFDLRFMNAEFMYLDRIFPVKNGFCTMRGLTDAVGLPRAGGGFKFPKLTELSEHYGIYPYDVTRKTAELFGSYSSSHDARYDTAELYMSFLRAAENGDDGGRLAEFEGEVSAAG